MILSDQDIKREIQSDRLMIYPLSEDTIRENGVDLRIGNKFGVFNNGGTIDTHSKGVSHVRVYEGNKFTIGENEHVLIHTKEKIKMPDNVVGFINLRSTYARYGLVLPPTVVDAGFEGELTIEVVGSSVPVIIYPNDRFVHLVFMYTNTPVKNTYGGKYQGQSGVTPSR